jgi:hypothetical protein
MTSFKTWFTTVPRSTTQIQRYTSMQKLAVMLFPDCRPKAGPFVISWTPTCSKPFTCTVPSSSELSSDTTTLLAALPTLFRLILTSAFFRLLLSDVRKLLAGVDVASVASDIQVAAEEMERAVDVDDEWFSVLQDKVDEVAQAVREHDPMAESQQTAKDIFIARVQEVYMHFLSLAFALALTLCFSSLFELTKIHKPFQLFGPYILS